MNETTAPSQKNRVATTDVIKGVLIIGIVIIHLLILTGPFNARHAPLIFECLYLGLMCFFIISGYFFRPEKSFAENTKKRFKQLLISIVAATLILSTLFYLWMMAWGKAPSLDDLLWTFQYGLGLDDLWLDPWDCADKPICLVAVSNYFLWVMLFSFVVFYATAKRVISDKRIFAVALIALLVIQALLTGYFRHVLPFFIHLTPMGIAFMYTGAFLAKYRFIETIDALPLRDVKKWIPLPICAVATYVMVMFIPNKCSFDLMIFGDNGGLSVFTFYVESLLAMVFYVYACALISRIPLVRSAFTISGKHTLAITYLHGFVAKFMMVPFFTFTTASVFPPGLSKGALVLFGIVVVIVILVGCYVKEYLMKTWTKKKTATE
jgi:fucose 4-O-acetylase-like acetyltransferase